MGEGFVFAWSLQKWQPSETEGIHLVSGEHQYQDLQRNLYRTKKWDNKNLIKFNNDIYRNSCMGEGKKPFNDREWEAVWLIGT